MINFWNDSWLNINRLLKDYFIGMDPLDETIRVYDVVDTAGD